MGPSFYCLFHFYKRMSKKGKKNLSGGMAGLSLEDGGSDGSDEELEQVEVKKSAFAALMDDAGDSLPSDNSDDDQEQKLKKEVVKKEAVKQQKTRGERRKRRRRRKATMTMRTLTPCWQL